MSTNGMHTPWTLRGEMVIFTSVMRVFVLSRLVTFDNCHKNILIDPHLLRVKFSL